MLQQGGLLSVVVNKLCVLLSESDGALGGTIYFHKIMCTSSYGPCFSSTARCSAVQAHLCVQPHLLQYGFFFFFHVTCWNCFRLFLVFSSSDLQFLGALKEADTHMERTYENPGSAVAVNQGPSCCK